MGFKFNKYPEVQRWYEQCKKLPGFEENEKSAKEFGGLMKSKLTKGF